nr:hypothetical protein [Tanacetum cinerariifolium]
MAEQQTIKYAPQWNNMTMDNVIFQTNNVYFITANSVLKGNSAKSMTTYNDGNLKIRHPATAEEHQQVQREEKARTILLSALPDEHMDQQLVYEDLDQMNKEEFKVYDLKHHMAMLSIKVHRFKKKHGRKIKFNGRENARFDKKLVKCFNCKQMGHFSWECRAQGGQNSNNYQKYKSKEAGKDGTESKAMVVVDGNIDWDKQTEEGHTEPRSLENFGMIAGIKIEFDSDSEGEVISANDAIPTGDFVSTSDVAIAIVSPPSETEFALMGLSTKAAQEKQELMTKLDNELANQAKWNNSGRNLYKLIDSSMSVRTKRGLGLDKYIGEGELGIDDSKVSIFYTNSDDLEGQPIYNRFASVDHIKTVLPSLTGNYMPPSNIPDIDESQMVYRKKANDSYKIKTNNDSISHSNDSVLFYFSDRSSEPSTNDLQTCDSSVECSRPNHSDHDSTDSISSVSTPASESRDTIVIDCDRQEDFTSVCTSSIETDVKSSKTLCNKFGSFNKESHFRKHKSVASKSCMYVVVIYISKKIETFMSNDSPKEMLKGRVYWEEDQQGNQLIQINKTQFLLVLQTRFLLDSKTQFLLQNTISAGQPNLVSVGQPNPVSAGDGILGPRPLNIQPKSTYFHSFTHNNLQIIFAITHNSLYSLYMTGGLNGKTTVKPSAGWPWTKYDI